MLNGKPHAKFEVQVKDCEHGGLCLWRGVNLENSTLLPFPSFSMTVLQAIKH